MVEALIVAEHDGRDLNPSTARCVSCASTIAGEAVDVAVFANRSQAVAEQAAALTGVRRVLCVDREENSPALAAMIAPQVAALASGWM